MAAENREHPMVVDLIKAADIKPEAVEYIWLDRIPKGRLTIVAGRPKQGKSMFEAFLAGAVTARGENVLISNVEDELADTQVPRLLAAGADMGRVHFWPGRRLKLPDMAEELALAIKVHKIGLVILDPIRKHCKRDVLASLEPLLDVASATGCAIVGIHHINKRNTRTADPMDAFGGSIGDYIGTARALYAFGPVGGDAEAETRVLAPAGSNVTPNQSSVEFYLDGDVTVDLDDDEVAQPGRLVLVSDESKFNALNVVTFNGGSGYKATDDNPEKRQVAGEWLTLMLMHGPMPARDVYSKAAEVGVSKMTMRRAADDLSLVKRRHGFGPNSYITWELPEGHPALDGLDTGGSNVAQTDIDAAIAELLGGGS